jgi:hypothetical protein
MKEVAKLLEDLKASGVIRDYALFDAVAQMRYTEPVATLDADVLVLLSNDTGLDVLAPIYNFCRKRGHAAMYPKARLSVSATGRCNSFLHSAA